MNDWTDLGKDYISSKMADMARRRSDEYLSQAFEKGWYKEQDVNHLPIMNGSMEAYHSVEFMMPGVSMSHVRQPHLKELVAGQKIISTLLRDSPRRR